MTRTLKNTDACRLNSWPVLIYNNVFFILSIIFADAILAVQAKNVYSVLTYTQYLLCKYTDAEIEVSARAPGSVSGLVFSLISCSVLCVGVQPEQHLQSGLREDPAAQLQARCSHDASGAVALLAV